MKYNEARHAGFTTIFSALVIANVSFPFQSTAQKISSGTHQFSLSSVGYKWHYRLHAPKSYDANQPTPVVLILHGAGGSGELYLDKAGWRAKAEEAGFIAVAPDGLPARPQRRANFFINPRLWNDGQLREDSPRREIDDVQFFRDLLDELQQKPKLSANKAASKLSNTRRVLPVLHSPPGSLPDKDTIGQAESKFCRNAAPAPIPIRSRQRK